MELELLRIETQYNGEIYRKEGDLPEGVTTEDVVAALADVSDEEMAAWLASDLPLAEVLYCIVLMAELDACPRSWTEDVEDFLRELLD